MRTLTAHVRKMAVALVAIGSLIGLTAGAASAAAGPPTVSTGPVSATTATTAVVSGAVDPHDHATTWYVSYGTTTGYGAKSATESAGSGSSGTAVSATLTGLKPQTTYHYAIVASNADGTVAGTDGIFTTLSPSLATTGVVSALTSTTLTLTGVVEPNGQATTYYFEFGPTTSYGTRTTTHSAGAGSSALAVSLLVSNLTPKTTYHYRLVAHSAAGHAYGDDATATTASDVSLQAQNAILTYGSSEVISGVVAGGKAGVTVAIVAEPAGGTVFAGIGTTTSSSTGYWSFTVKPSLLTSYEAAVAGGYSPPIAISVRPAIAFSAQAGNMLSAKVTAGVPFAHHVAQIQRLVNGEWVLVRHFALGAGGRAVVPASVLPHGRSTVRVAIGTTVVGPNQAGTGYLAGISSTISYVR